MFALRGAPRLGDLQVLAGGSRIGQGRVGRPALAQHEPEQDAGQGRFDQHPDDRRHRLLPRSGVGQRHAREVGQAQVHRDEGAGQRRVRQLVGDHEEADGHDDPRAAVEGLRLRHGQRPAEAQARHDDEVGGQHRPRPAGGVPARCRVREVHAAPGQDGPADQGGHGHLVHRHGEYGEHGAGADDHGAPVERELPGERHELPLGGPRGQGSLRWSHRAHPRIALLSGVGRTALTRLGKRP